MAEGFVEPWNVDNVPGTTVAAVVGVGVGVVVLVVVFVVVAAVAAVLSVVAVDAVRCGASSHLKTTATLRGRSGRRGGSAGAGLLSEVSTLSALSFHLYSPHARATYNIYIYVYVTSRPRHDAHSNRENTYITCIYLYTHIYLFIKPIRARQRESPSEIVVLASPLPMYLRERLNVGS